MFYCGLGKKIKIVLVFMTVMVCVASIAFAGTTGKIAGKVIDKKTNEGLPGVNIVVDGTTMGAATGTDGNYYILNIPVGPYTITASIIGYQKVQIQNVAVSADLTTPIDFQMSETVIEGEVMVIKAERPLIQKDQTASIKITSAEEIQNLPVRDYQEVVGASAGIVQFQENASINNGRSSGIDEASTNLPQLSVRGGRANQVAYIVDGFSVQDPITGTTTMSITPDAIGEIAIMTGGFNAEYGRIMSGAINVSTKRGQKSFHGSASAVTDNVGLSGEPQDYNIYDLSLSGPVIPGNSKINFFVSGSRGWERNREPLGNVPSKYFDVISDIPGDSTVADYDSDGNPIYSPTVRTFDNYKDKFELFRDDVLPGNFKSSWSWQAKLGIDVGDKMKIDIGTLGSQDDWQQYTHSRIFQIEHAPYYEDRNASANIKLTYQLNKDTFFNVAGNYFATERFRGDGVFRRDYFAYGVPKGNATMDDVELFWAWDDMHGITETEYTNYGWDTSVYGAEAASWDSVAFITGNYEANIFDDYILRKSSYYGFDFDITSQIHAYHELKAGFDMQKHTLRYFRDLWPSHSYRYLDDPETASLDVDRYGFTFDPLKNEIVEDDDPTGNGLDGPKKPTTLSLYLQDKFEYEGIVINFGLRYDYLDVNTKQSTDPDSVLVNGPRPAALDPEDVKDADAQTAFSPRLGIGFPVTDNTVFHASYGTFYQQPNLFDLYVSYDYLEYKVQSGGYFYPFGNPNLEWEKTTAYEVGIRHQLSDVAVLEITTYYKSIEDLVQVRSIRSFPESFASYRNIDFGTVTGFDFNYQTRRMNNLMMNLAYSLSWAKGTGSNSNSTRNIAWHGTEPPKTSQPLDFDQRHKFTFNFDYRYANNAPISYLNNFGVNVLGSFASGSPYTPAKPYNEVTLAAVTPEPTGPVNSRYGPWVFRMDMKANKTIQISGLNMNFYVLILNVLDRSNAVDVYESSGDPQSTSYLSTAQGHAIVNDPGVAESHDTSGLSATDKFLLKEQDPRNFDLPRIVRLGLELSF